MTQYDDIIDLKRLYYILKRQKFVIIVTTTFFLSLASVYLFVTPEKYVAKTIILLDKTVTNTISNVSSINLTTYNSAAIDSEVEILKSKRITDSVVNALEQKGYFSNIAQNLPKRDAILYNKIQNNLSVSRVEQTYALSIAYKSTDPKEAADVANAFADAYIADQLNLLYETSNRTISWLQQKAEEIKEKSKEARSRLSEYRSQYNAETQKFIGNEEKDINEAYNTNVSLREFETLKLEVETYDKMYDSYIEKMHTISLEKSFPVTETLVYTYATPPIKKSEPKSALIT
ncbi:MAG: hypothetical protein KAJ40_04150, partial [Alphaproteobacteria bacterium]|nr:hypothetical protein [Alphaproteobacteria bacterium]